MRVLLDECLPRALTRWLSGHEISTVQEAGWTGAKNGQILSLAQGRFDVFLTADRKLKYQQNLRGRRLAIIVLPSNRLQVLQRIVPDIEAALAQVVAGVPDRYIEVTIRPGRRA